MRLFKNLLHADPSLPEEDSPLTEEDTTPSEADTNLFDKKKKKKTHKSVTKQSVAQRLLHVIKRIFGPSSARPLGKLWTAASLTLSSSSRFSTCTSGPE